MLKIYEILKKVPKGKVTTYSCLAKALHTSPRAIGALMRINPYAPSVPCHRVVMSDGSLGGYSGGIKKKISLLRSECIEIKNKKVDLKNYFFDLNSV